MLQRVERHINIGGVNHNRFEELTHLSKNLYNYTNYLMRQHFFETSKMLNEYELTTLLAKEKQIDYISMPSAQSSQQTIKLLFKNWKSYFNALNKYKINPKGFLGRPKLPKYKAKEGHNIIVFTNQNCIIKNGYIHFPKKAKILPIKTKVSSLKQLRIIPNATCFIVEIIYEKEAQTLVHDNENYLSLDLGLNNLVTSFNNIGLQPFIINGKIVKSINQFYNKTKAKLMSFIGDKGTSTRINALTHKRNQKINDQLHKSSRYIIDYCVKHNISKIVIGNNKEWKQNINIGKRNNQNFVTIPHARLISQLEYKGEEVGIKIITTEESYTSKIDHLANEEMKHQAKYLGKRVKRGLFRSSLNRNINADVNGAIGILRKVVPNEVFKTLGDRGTVFVPNIINF